MKKIGILLREKDNYKVVNDEIVNYLSDYDVSLVGIIEDSSSDFSKIIDVINLCDGVVLIGGRDESKIGVRIANYLWQNNKPTLGICLGMQNMAEAFNGTIEKLPTEFHNSKYKYVHNITIKKGSLLYKILNTNSILVNSRHLYEINNTNLSISAYSEDCVIEAVEDAKKKFYLGVGWHPESIKNDLNSMLIIDEFIKSCK